MKKTFLPCLAAITLGFDWSPTAFAQAAGDRVPDHYIVELQPGANSAAVAARHGIGPTFVYSAAIKGFAGRIPPGLLPRVQNDPQVRSITPDRVVFAIQSANGKPGGGGTTPPPGQVIPAGVTRIGAAPTDNLGVNGAGVGVAIVDTGIDLFHPDLIANVGSVSYNAFSTTGESGLDDHGHGTHVAGIVAAENNGIGVVGVASGATLFAVKVLDAGGSGSDAIVIAGLEWVAANAATATPPIRVVNMSLGRLLDVANGETIGNSVMRAAVQSLTIQGVAVVVAAGNDASVTISQQVPAAYPEVIAIASTTAKNGVAGKVGRSTISIPADTASYFTTDGFDVAISAPGEDQEDVKTGGFLSSVGILSTALGGGTTRMSGTSMASPHAAGVAALILSKNPTLSTEEVRTIIRTGASGIGLAPLNSPTSAYTFDTVREGVLSAPGALNSTPTIP